MLVIKLEERLNLKELWSTQLEQTILILEGMWVQMMGYLVKINITITGIKISQAEDKSAFMPLLGNLKMGLLPLIKPYLGIIGDGMQVVMLTIRI